MSFTHVTTRLTGEGCAPCAPDVTFVDAARFDDDITNGCVIEIAHDLAAVAGYWPRFDRAEPAICSPFQLYEFLEVWGRTIGTARGARWHLVTVREARGAGRPLLLFPLVVESERGVRLLRFADGGVCDYNMPIQFPWTPSFIAQQFRELWDEIVDKIPTMDAVALENMPAAFAGRANPMLHLDCQKGPMDAHGASLCRDWETFIEQRITARKTFSKIQKKLRKLQKRCDVRFRTIRGVEEPERAKSALDAMFRQKHQRFVETNVPDFFIKDQREAFYRQMTVDPHAGPHVVFGQLMAGDTAISNMWGIIHGDCCYCLVSSYEGGEWGSYSPGRLINQHVIEWCHEARLSVVDYCLGDEPYKFEFCDRHVPLHVYREPKSARGRAYFAITDGLSWCRASSFWRRVRPLKRLLFPRKARSS